MTRTAHGPALQQSLTLAWRNVVKIRLPGILVQDHLTAPTR